MGFGFGDAEDAQIPASEDCSDFGDSSLASSKTKIIQRNYARTSNFLSVLKDVNVNKTTGPSDEGDGDESSKLNDDGPVWKYLNGLYTFGQDKKIDRGHNLLEINFDTDGFQSINAESLPDLTKQPFSECIILIEFFTHCCINCIHSIEDVRQVYEEIVTTEKYKSWPYAESLKVISVHSPKFTREKDEESIKAFCERMKMDYSIVINDPGCSLWNELGISCWPTLLVLGPNPVGNGMNLLFTLMGEGHKQMLNVILKSTLKFFHEKLRMGPNTSRTVVDSRKKNISESVPSALKFPGKVSYYNGLLAIADAGNHRIVIADLNGKIKHIIGGSKRGYLDSDFITSQFYLPQGVAFRSEQMLYVADTGNHAIRVVNVDSGTVSTIISPTWTCEHENEIISLRSPWDLAFYSEDVLFVAGAGNHRIFAYFFESSKLFMKEFPKKSFAIIAGTGKEENRNNSYILKASFAQPSGICVMTESQGNSRTIYIADSESSSIRSIVTDAKGKVSAVAGGAKDPRDLFAYGDADGKGVFAKLQHPMGVCSDDENAKVYFVDTYNHKVKVIDAKTQICTTLVGDGTPGNHVGRFASDEQSNNDMARLNEPGGITIDPESKILFVADTNNHLIKSVNLRTNTVQTIVLSMPPKTEEVFHYDDTFDLSAFAKEITTFKVAITNLPKNVEGGQWRLLSSLSKKPKSTGGMDVNEESGIGTCLVTIPSHVDRAENQLQLSVDLFYCGTASCNKKTFIFLITNTTSIIESITNIDIDNEIPCFTFKLQPGLFN